jgi:SAM-dependent methyltransferase
MDSEFNYIDKNRNLWNIWTDYHVHSGFYNLQGFIKGESSLNDIELTLLGDIRNKTILHLQCHFGQDTLSLARRGAIPTGIDLSDNAIGKANELAVQLNLNARFICCDIYDLPGYLNEKFDVVFTSYGTISWLPDLDTWGRIISNFLKPDGMFVLVEFHPIVWMFDYDFNKVEHSYFNKEAIVELEQGTYADSEAPVKMESITWNHALSEVFHGLANNGLQINDLKEYDYSPYNFFKHSEQVGERKFIIKHLGDKIPLVYSIVASKKSIH